MIKKIRIFGVTYQIKLASRETIDEHWGNNKDGLIGLTEPSSCTIYVLETLSQERKQQTLYHEIVHAILAEIDYDDVNDDERFVDLMGHAILEIVNNSRT